MPSGSDLDTERALRETAEFSRDMWRETAFKHADRMERAEDGCHAAMFAAFVHALRAEIAAGQLCPGCARHEEALAEMLYEEAQAASR